MKKSITSILLSAGLLAGITLNANAAPVTELVFKLGVDSMTKLDAYTGWTTAGGFNEGNAVAQQLDNAALDFKSTLVDNWPIADMSNVRVAFYIQGVEQAYIDFDPAGTSNTSFFAAGNVTGSNWIDLAGSGNYFSIDGHEAIDRHWFINNNYGGCTVDVGHMVVIDTATSQPCSWENGRVSNGRAFLYSTASTEENWTTGNIGVADVFAVFVTRDVQAPPPATGVPVPAPLALLGLGLVALARRRR